MGQITLGWIVAMLQATAGVNRSHGTNLDVIKAVRDQEASGLSSGLTLVSGVFISLTVALLGFLSETMTPSRETGSRTIVNGTETTVVKTFSDQNVTDLTVYLIVSLVVLTFGTVSLLVTNRGRHNRLSTAYARTVQLYFLLSRQIP